MPYVDIANGKLVIAFATPVVRDGAVKAVVSGDIAMDRVIANVKSIHSDAGELRDPGRRERPYHCAPGREADPEARVGSCAGTHQ
jgi:hypothetical protein